MSASSPDCVKTLVARLLTENRIYQLLSETGICFKFTETSPDEYNGVIINPEAIPPDDIDEVILSEMRQEALEEFKKVLNRR